MEIDDLCDGINNVLIKPAIVAGISTYKMFSVNSSRKTKNNVSMVLQSVKLKDENI